MRGAALAALVPVIAASYSFGAPSILSPPCPAITVDAQSGVAILCMPTQDTHGNVLGIRRTLEDDTVQDNTLRHCTVAETYESGGIGTVYQLDESSLAGHRTLSLRVCERVGAATLHAECSNDIGVSDSVRIGYVCDPLGAPSTPSLAAPFAWGAQ